MERVIKMLQHRLDNVNGLIASDEKFFNRLLKSGKQVPKKLRAEYDSNCDLMFQLMRAIQYLTKQKVSQ